MMENPTDDNMNTDDNPSIQVPLIPGPSNGDARYWRESHHLLTLFPSVVWDHICSFLDHQDFLNLINSSLVLRELFLQKRVVVLYKPVLELLLPRLQKESKSVSTWRHQDRTVDLFLMNSRAVCKTWKRTIDEKACIYIPDDKTGENNYVHHLLVGKNKFLDCEKFLGHFMATHSSSVNPFIGKHICLRVELGTPEYPQLNNQISILLEKYGDHLLTCDIRFNYGNLNPPEIHRKFVEWLEYMPNLQNLKISAIFAHGVDIPMCRLEIEAPKLKDLKTLGINTVMFGLLNEDPPEWCWLDRFHLNKFVTGNDNLEYLYLTLNDIEILKKFKSPLKNLKVECQFREGESRVADVFSQLSLKFSGTLENLTAIFRVSGRESDIQVIRDSCNGRLHLSKVRKFEINVENAISLDFLLEMKDNLEELVVCGEEAQNIVYSDFDETEQEEIRLLESSQIVEFLGYRNKMMESNIWGLFPKLDRIVLKGAGTNLEYKRGGGMNVLQLW